jgi:hypothetical protein
MIEAMGLEIITSKSPGITSIPNFMKSTKQFRSY